MRRKEDADQLKKKQTMKQQTFDYSYDTQISILLPYLKIMPITMRSKFLMGLKQNLEKETLSQACKNAIDKMLSYSTFDSLDHNKNSFLLDLFCRYLKLNKLKDHYLVLSKKNSYKQKHQQNSHNHQITSSCQPFEPNIQKPTSKLEPISQIINPNYENIIKMYKNFTDIHMNMQYKIKDLNENYTFFAQPRFITKLLEIHDFQSGFSEKGNIVMMSFQGSKIVGKRGFAFVHGTAIYWWEKKYKDVKDILPDFLEDKEKDEKNINKKKEIQKQQTKNDDSEAPRFNQEFKLSYKLVGHHGKITSLSLSDDQYYLISAGTDKVIKLWCLRQKCLLAEYRGHVKTIWSVSFSKSGYFFLSGSADKTAKLWSTDDSIAQRVYVGHQDDVTKVDFLQNPDLLASASQDRTVRIWNTLTTECINIFRLDSSAINFKNSISGRYFVVCDSKGKITLYDLLKGEVLSSFRVPEKQQENEQQKANYLKIHDMCFSMDEKQFSCVSSKYIVIYSLDKICEKQSKCLFSESGKDSAQRIVATKEVIYTGRDSNMIYCDYLDKGVLLVATTSSKKY